ncbi:MAG: hypothetical protein JNM93_07960 [Bacteriovoracaceae bacterium]|nr:hypothetical protein [Bacteriovoracaceae bacterium]
MTTERTTTPSAILNAAIEETHSTIEHKSVKSSPDIENFYRFVYENSLREEAHKLLAFIVDRAKPKKKRKKKNSDA